MGNMLTPKNFAVQPGVNSAQLFPRGLPILLLLGEHRVQRNFVCLPAVNLTGDKENS